MRLAAFVSLATIGLALGLAQPVDAASKTKKSAGKTSKSAKAEQPAKTKSSKAKRKAAALAATAALPVVAFRPLPPEPLSAAQLSVADRVQTGRADCEFEQSVQIDPDARRPGAFHVKYKAQVYSMVPEETSTGAVRLVDPSAGVVWLQIPIKSMLMNARAGQRMVDACTNPMQRIAQTESDMAALAAALAAVSPAPAVVAAPPSPAVIIAPVDYAASLPAGDSAQPADPAALPAQAASDAVAAQLPVGLSGMPVTVPTMAVPPLVVAPTPLVVAPTPVMQRSLPLLR